MSFSNNCLKLKSFKDKCNIIHENKYDYSLVEFIKGTPNVIIICLKHGNFTQSRYSHLKGIGCKQCSIDKKSKSMKDTTASFIFKAKKVHGDYYDYSLVNYISSKENVDIICKTHGTFSQKPNNHLTGYGCNSCGVETSSEKQSLSLEVFIERSNEVHNFKYDYTESEYNNFKTKIKINCKEHGDFYQKPNDHLNGRGCSKCSKAISKEELEVLDYILSLNTKYSIVTSYRPEWLERKELDIYIKDLNLAIEYNGSIFHHSSKSDSITNSYIKNTYKDRLYHFNKWKLCFENNVTLISIYDFYWQNPLKQELYKSKIYHALNLDNKVYARKCILKCLDNKIAYDFYENNHLEGSGFKYKNSKSFGLYYKDTLIMCCTVGDYYNQSAKKFKTKLHRICTLKFHTVVGGLSKLCKELKKSYPTFDYQITLSSGGTTINHLNNFEIIPPRYFWVNSKNIKEYYHRNYCQKHKLEKHFKELLKPEDTESSYMERSGFLKVHDNGLAKLEIK